MMEEAYRVGITPNEFRSIHARDLEVISRIRAAKSAKAEQQALVQSAMAGLRR